MNKKKILIFIDWFLPGYKAGGPIRSVANLTAWLSNEFEFFIITRNTDYLENTPYPNIESNQWIKHSENIHAYYFSKNELSIKNIKKIVSEQHLDTVYINGIYSFYFSLLPVYIFKKTLKKVIVASRGMLSEHSFSSKNFKKKIFIFLANLTGFYKNVVFQVTNKREKEEVSKLIHNSKGYLIAPNLPSKINELPVKNRIKKERVLKLVSIARISKEKNTLFALQLLSKVNYSGKIYFNIYGSVYQRDYWNECLRIIKLLPENVVVKYKGEINNNIILKTVQNHHFLFLPTMGENFGHSILESFSAACPVIISNQTPWKNLEEKAVGWDIALADTDKFIKTIQYCIDMKQEEYNKLSENAYKFANEFANNPKLVEQSRKLFD